MTISFLEAENFRSYKKIHIDFDPGINIIIGENDSGKTNLLRIINWVANNRPSGEDMRSNWGGNTIGCLGIIDNDQIQVIERFRSDSENLYKIDSQKDPFKSFGQKVPEPIAKILNINPVNIHFQLEGPFLLGKSPSDVARHYNDAVNLEIIDRSIKNISKILWNENDQLKKLKADQVVKEEKLKEFDWLPEAEKKIIDLEKMQGFILHLEQEYIQLSKWNDDLKGLIEKQDKINEVIQHEKAVNYLLELDKKIELGSAEYNELDALSSKLKELKIEFENVQEVLKHESKAKELIAQAENINKKFLEIIELKRLINELSSLNQTASKYSEISKLELKANELIALDKRIDIKTNEYNELFDLVARRNELKKNLDNINQALLKLNQKFNEMMPDVCPLCNRSCDCEHL